MEHVRSHTLIICILGALFHGLVVLQGSTSVLIEAFQEEEALGQGSSIMEEIDDATQSRYFTFKWEDDFESMDQVE